MVSVIGGGSSEMSYIPVFFQRYLRYRCKYIFLFRRIALSEVNLYTVKQEMQVYSRYKRCIDTLVCLFLGWDGS